jgi:hypothetical protein
LVALLTGIPRRPGATVAFCYIQRNVAQPLGPLIALMHDWLCGTLPSKALSATGRR